MDEIKKGHEKYKHPILDDAQYEKTLAAAQATVLKEQVDAATKALKDQEVNKLRLEMGMKTNSPLDEEVTLTLDLPSPEINTYINVNGPEGQYYFHGHTYTVPRHVAHSLMETSDKLRRYEAREIDGKNPYAAYRKQQDVQLAGRPN